MRSLCLNAGAELQDLLWAANVLPFLRRALPETRLIWECQRADALAWLRLYPCLDEVISDVEILPSPPETYLILHPAWSRHGGTGCDGSSLAALFDLLQPWCPRPEPLPDQPCLPPGLPKGATEQEAYLCFEPPPEKDGLLAQADLPIWAALTLQSPLPVVQVGPAGNPLLPKAKDARGAGPLELARLAAGARLVVAADTGLSSLTQALGGPQIWFETRDDWCWPRAETPLCRRLNPRVEGASIAAKTLAAIVSLLDGEPVP